MVKIAVSEPPEGEVEEPNPPARLGRGGSISCWSRGRSLEKKFSHATLARDEGGGLAGEVPALARRADEPLTLTRGDAAEGDRCFSVVAALGAEDDDDAAELLLLLLPEEDELPPLDGEELLDDLDEESTEDDARRDCERVDREPQLEMKFLADGDAAADGEAIAGVLRLDCLSKERA